MAELDTTRPKSLIARAGAISVLFGAGCEALVVAAIHDPSLGLHVAVAFLSALLFAVLVVGFAVPAEKRAAEVAQREFAAAADRDRLTSIGSAVGVIAHDLRNSLATARLIGERLAQSEDPRVVAAAPRLERVLERAVALAEAARAFAKGGEQSPQVRPTPLRPLVQACADERAKHAPTVSWRIDIDPAEVAAIDPGFTRTILTALFENAARALADRPGVVTVTLMREGDALALLVKDDGPGVPAHKFERLFQPFASEGAGVGLGLAVSRELARAQGGDLRLAGNGPDGAAFVLKLQQSAPLP